MAIANLMTAQLARHYGASFSGHGLGPVGMSGALKQKVLRVIRRAEKALGR